ncbi:MAG: ATP-dependent DNA helicase RecQ [uncultured Sphingomonadaceae bacterium]|uniref:DNA helicase RecQ n=1 Tax=uncultured Sphingomonadaceae bacterium TaxID=169976 RepID=A0A6J4SZU5_9SPHN|nr:MAG: ATP-dependent DNA helicase RecQ [uncultured Sphingomonadaceae bacterium]
MPADPLHLLQTFFGFPAFRGVQEAVIARVLRGEHTLAIMPTGAGKSLCYQLPALARPGTGLVISPLIALMHDQVRSATALGIRAAALSSADADREETVARLLAGELDLLYVAPERASQPGFANLLRRVPLALAAIDEAHCVSEWGHDFRPDYRLLRPLLDGLGDVPRLALTATADETTRVDILAQLGIPVEGMIVSGFDRPNIRYQVSPKTNTTRQLAEFVERQRGAGIVYVQSRAKTEQIAAQIAATGRAALPYHAGLPPEQRAANQAKFVGSEDMVMAATIAFGMGIDKPDVRFVVHAGLPKSIEAYYQETGRAGRDGDPAVAQLYWGAADFALARERLSEVEPERRDGERARLSALSELVEATSCRRALLLRYFGEDVPLDRGCGNCDNCLAPPATVDATEVARKLLSAAYRTGQRFGVTHLVDVLTGRNNERAAALGHDRLSVAGIVTEVEAPLLAPVARALQARGALVANEHGGLALGASARALLRGEAELQVVVPPPKKRKERRRARDEAEHEQDPVFDALRARRRELAQAAAVPPYVVFHDSVLRAMALARPATLGELGRIAGVGAAKLERYGEAFLEVLREAG